MIQLERSAMRRQKLSVLVFDIQQGRSTYFADKMKFLSFLLKFVTYPGSASSAFCFGPFQRRITLLLAFAFTLQGCAKKVELDQKLEAANREFDARRTEQALVLYKQILEAEPSHPGAQIMTARIHYYDRKFPEAEKILLEAASDHPENIDVLFWLARVQSVLPGKKDAALETLDRLLAVDGARLDALVLKGLLHEERKETAKAIGAYRAVLRAEPDLATAYTRLASIYGSAGLDDMKNKALLKAALLQPEAARETKENK